MERFDPSAYIQNSSKLTEIFGYWPSFHDAEVHGLSLSIGDGEPWVQGSISPVLDLLVHVFEMTKEVDETGHFVLTKHTFVRLRFQGVQDIQFSDFTYQNCIFELIFGIEAKNVGNGAGAAEGTTPDNVLAVTIGSSFGLSGQFRCRSAGVISAEPCDDQGNLLAV